MREIKFRAWDKVLKEFKCPDLWDSSMPSNWRDYYELTQYTGLKDKNGVEIYEGDIVKINGASEKHQIKFESGQFGYGSEHMFSSFHCLQRDDCILSGYNSCFGVIGNIYENPELQEAL